VRIENFTCHALLTAVSLSPKLGGAPNQQDLVFFDPFREDRSMMKSYALGLAMAAVLSLAAPAFAADAKPAPAPALEDK
jgi:hypothetical protein